MNNINKELKEKRRNEVANKVYTLRNNSCIYIKYLKIFYKIQNIPKCSDMLRIFGHADINAIRKYNKVISDSELSESEKAELYINEELFI